MRPLRTESSLMMMAMWLLGLVSATSGQAPTPPMGSFDVLSFRAKADGKTDDTAAIQKALDATGKLGGVVRFPAGKFLTVAEGRGLMASSLSGRMPPVSKRERYLFTCTSTSSCPKLRSGAISPTKDS